MIIGVSVGVSIAIIILIILFLYRKRKRRLRAPVRRSRLTLDPSEPRDSDVDHLHTITPFPLHVPFNDSQVGPGVSTENENLQLSAAARLFKRLKSTASDRMRPSQTRAANDIDESPSRPAGSASITAIMDTLQRLQEQIVLIAGNGAHSDVTNGGGGRQQSMRSVSSSATYVVD